MVLHLLNNICFNVFILIVLYETNALIEYFKLIYRFEWVQKITPTTLHEYIRIVDAGGQVKLFDYLKESAPNFFTKMLSCPACLNFWLTIITGILFWDLQYFLIVYVGALLLLRGLTMQEQR